jgi:hypothetical protein
VESDSFRGALSVDSYPALPHQSKQRLYPINIYTKAFNTKNNRSGTLFEGPYKAIQVDRNEFLLHLCRYIHRNPLEAGLVVKPEQWRYSNYAEFIGKRNESLVDREFIKMNFGSPEVYEDFVMNYVPPEKTQKELRHYLFWD